MKQLNQTLKCACDWKRVLLNTLLIVLIVVGFIACPITKADDAVMKAYNLRINGEVEKAKTLLGEFISKNPDNALANYELARTCLYMLTGDMKNLKQHLGDAETAINKALSYEPENIIYLYLSSRVTFTKSYLGLKTDSENAKDYIAKVCDALKTVLEVKPDYGEVILNLVEIYGGLPEEMGGDPSKANQYVSKLESIDPVMGAKGRAMLLPEGEDPAEFWKGILEKHPDNVVVLEELGKVYLRNDKPDEGIKYLEKTLKIDPSKNLILLDIARYYGYKLMNDKSKKDDLIPPAKEALNRYLATKPIAPLKAYAKNSLARLFFIDGNKDQGNKLVKEAEALDKYYSRASAIPSADLFIKPGEEAHNHTYWFQPF